MPSSGTIQMFMSMPGVCVHAHVDVHVHVRVCIHVCALPVSMSLSVCISMSLSMSMSMGNEKGKQNYANDIHLYWEEIERENLQKNPAGIFPLEHTVGMDFF